MQAIRDFFGRLLIRNRDAARGDCFMRRLVCLDGLRGVLAFYVMLSHTLPFTPMPGWLVWLFSHGGAGVDVFFILSGLVIVQSLASFDYRARPFLIARVMRIYPVFIAVFIAAVAVQPLATGFERMAWIGPDSPARFIWSGGWPNDWGLFIAAHLTMTHGLFPDGVLPDVWVGFLGAAWSLSTEWQFYLLALLIGGRLGLRALAWLFLVVSATAIAWHALVPDAWQFSRAFLPNKAQYFALGIASAIVVRDGTKGLGAYLTVLGVTLVLCVGQGGVDKLLPPMIWSLCLAAQLRSAPSSRSSLTMGTGSMAATVGMTMGLFAVALRSRPLVWLGAVSYCIYLVNEPVQKLLGVTLAVVVQGNAALFTALWLPGAVVLPVLAAWWLHQWIEAPALRWGRARARRDMPAAPVPISAG
jgi:peptidoglycan/LPS O-acetylase OafA/YrhL